MRASRMKGLLLVPFLLFLFTVSASAQNFVYTDNNTVGANSVTAFSIGSNGALTNIGTFATGGSGAGAGFTAANRARVCATGNRLYVSNGGSGDVSGFDINTITGALSLVPGSPFATGGTAGAGISIDCTPNGQFLIAANAGSSNITVFSIAANGALTPVAGSPFAAGGVNPDGVKVAPNGRFLSVALLSSDAVAMFSIASNGMLTPVAGSPFASPAIGAAAGVDINCESNRLFVSQNSNFGTNVDVYSIGSSGGLTLVQTSSNSTAGKNSNVCALSPNQQFLFVSNQEIASVTVFVVASNGTLSLVPGSPFGGTGGDPSGLATNAAGTFLFTANSDESNVTSFSIAGNGALALVGNFATGRPLSSGLASLAVFPAKPGFDVCLQDDANPGLLFQFSSTSGAYLFTDCGPKGFALCGKGTVSTKNVCTIELRDNRVDRSVTASLNQCQRSGAATIQVVRNLVRVTYVLTDRKTVDDSCTCPP